LLGIITGKVTDHLILEENTNRYFHKDIYADYLNLKNEALKQGIELYVLSSFRSFKDQLRIWNLKASGQRDLLDDEGNTLEFNELSPNEILFSILRWSALPGASRHHWGTDIDFVDKATWPQGYDVQLIPSEYNDGGPFYKFRNWFDETIEKKSGLGFFRPYQNDRGGVAPEMWHLSHRAVSEELLHNYSIDLFKQHIDSLNESEFLLLDEVRDNFEKIYHDYIINISRD
jgi:LAS superfamily LD-carboxypeptidase LdcB